MSDVRSAWESFWFDKEDPSALAVVRIAFYGFLLLTSWKFWGIPRPWADVPAEFWDPVGLFALLPRPNVVRIDVLWPVWHIALGFACVGLFTRAATIVSFLLGLYLVGVSGMFGVLSHTNHVEIITLGILAAAPCGDAWSIDALRKSARNPSGDYRWPIQTIRVAVMFVYFSAGVAKLIHSGFRWISSETLAIYVARGNSYYYDYEYPPKGGWAMDLVRAGWPVHVMAASTLAFELLFPLAVLSKRARILLVPSAVMMNVCAFFFMGPMFVQLTFLNLLIWLPWHRVVEAALAVLPWRGKMMAETIGQGLTDSLPGA
jgi:hypothetical protein